MARPTPTVKLVIGLAAGMLISGTATSEAPPLSNDAIRPAERASSSINRPCDEVVRSLFRLRWYFTPVLTTTPRASLLAGRICSALAIVQTRIRVNTRPSNVCLDSPDSTPE